MLPKISIVTIIFNKGQFIKHTIESILSQKNDNIEYIIVDPGNTDGSREIIQEYSHIIDKIIFKSDSSPAEGLNNGFALASGEIFGYLNSDDILLPNTLTRDTRAALLVRKNR